MLDLSRILHSFLISADTLERGNKRRMEKRKYEFLHNFSSLYKFCDFWIKLIRMGKAMI